MIDLFGLGSSPRVWGQVILTTNATCDIRIIPTRVGTRIMLGKMNLIHGDHPHACGDKPLKADFNVSASGSSPRVWGQGCIF